MSMSNYIIENGILKHCNIGKEETIIIPDGVTEIWEDIFEENETVKKIVVSGGVPCVGGFCKTCKSLEEIEFSEGLTEIEDEAFTDCDSLRSVVLPRTIKKIGRAAFLNCSKLTKINLPHDLEEIGEIAFSGCSGLADERGFVVIRDVLYHYSSGESSVCIPYGIKAISGAFLDNKIITTVEIPDSVEKIGDFAFSGCEKLTSIELSDRVEVIGENAFEGCCSLTHVTIPAGVRVIGEAAFSGCTGLADSDGFVVIRKTAYAYCGSDTEVRLPDGVERTCNTFCENKKIKTVILPNGLKRIGGFTFVGCENLESVLFPNSVQEIGEEAFSRCSKLRKLELPEGLTSIDTSAFLNCSALTSLFIPDSVEYLGHGLFENCESLVRAHLPEQLEDLPEDTFRKCSSLIEIILPRRLKRIGAGAFAFCKNVFELAIPDSVTEIGEGVFIGCGGLRDMVIPPKITVINTGLFAKCSNLRHVVLPEGIEQINMLAFSECRNLKDISLPEKMSTIGLRAFESCSVLTEIRIPDSIESIGNGAFSGCINLNNAVIEHGVKEIGEKAFFNCRDLKTVVIPGSVKTIGFAAFYNCEKLVIHTPKNSYGYMFAEINQIPNEPFKRSEEEWKRILQKKHIQAESGDPAAQMAMVTYYYSHGKDGNPEEKSIKECLNWVYKAAAQNYAPAYSFLGTIYNKGIYVEKDDDKAVEYYRAAAELGHSESQFMLALMYFKGYGMDAPDKQEFSRWLFKSAENNNLRAITMIAKLSKRYKEGMSVKDLVFGELIRRAITDKIADMDRVRSDAGGVIKELSDRGDSLAKLLYDASELPKLKFAERFKI